MINSKYFIIITLHFGSISKAKELSLEKKRNSKL